MKQFDCSWKRNAFANVYMYNNAISMRV